MSRKEIIFVVFFILISASLYTIKKTTDSVNNLNGEIREELAKDLPPAEGVLLLTGYRTGSSFFGELFDQNDDVFYLFEPDRYFGDESWSSKMLDLFQCNFTNPNLIDTRFPGSIIFHDRSRVLSSNKFCDGKKCEHFNSSKAEAFCREKKVVVKTIKHRSIEALLQEAERRKFDLRIILFFRDPRPVFLSRRNAGELDAYYLSISNYCSEKLEQHDFFVEHPELHSRLKFQTFEDLASEPEDGTKKIYDFIKWDIPAKLLSWIQKNTHKNSGGEYGTSRNSKAEISKWRNEIEEEEKFLIDTLCKDYLTALNYDK